ncbi:MAG: hypothetical protein M1833_003493 [Piccolia ochrophora]|nr:MAG: hypothetical protein M1833_003493 [Piccolia ochrophora]
MTYSRDGNDCRSREVRRRTWTEGDLSARKQKHGPESKHSNGEKIAVTSKDEEHDNERSLARLEAPCSRKTAAGGRNSVAAHKDQPLVSLQKERASLDRSPAYGQSKNPWHPPMTLPNVVLITGSNQGVGHEIARQLGSKRGYHIILSGRDIEGVKQATERLRESGMSVEAMHLDVTDDEAIMKTAGEITKIHGKLDVLINNAAVYQDQDIVTDKVSIRNVMQSTFNTNVAGPAVVLETFLPLLRRSDNPRVIFVSSGYASLALTGCPEFHGMDRDKPLYKASKAAVNMLTRHYAVTLEDVRVNAVCPGPVKTRMNDWASWASPVEDGAVEVVRVVMDNSVGTGTFTNKEGVIPW